MPWLLPLWLLLCMHLLPLVNAKRPLHGTDPDVSLGCRGFAFQGEGDVCAISPCSDQEVCAFCGMWKNNTKVGSCCPAQNGLDWYKFQKTPSFDAEHGWKCRWWRCLDENAVLCGEGVCQTGNSGSKEGKKKCGRSVNESEPCCIGSQATPDQQLEAHCCAHDVGVDCETPEHKPCCLWTGGDHAQPVRDPHSPCQPKNCDGYHSCGGKQRGFNCLKSGQEVCCLKDRVSEWDHCQRTISECARFKPCNNGLGADQFGEDCSLSGQRQTCCLSSNSPRPDEPCQRDCNLYKDLTLSSRWVEPTVRISSCVVGFVLIWGIIKYWIKQRWTKHRDGVALVLTASDASTAGQKMAGFLDQHGYSVWAARGPDAQQVKALCHDFYRNIRCCKASVTAIVYVNGPTYEVDGERYLVLRGGTRFGLGDVVSQVAGCSSVTLLFILDTFPDPSRSSSPASTRRFCFKPCQRRRLTTFTLVRSGPPAQDLEESPLVVALVKHGCHSSLWRWLKDAEGDRQLHMLNPTISSSLRTRVLDLWMLPLHCQRTHSLGPSLSNEEAVKKLHSFCLLRASELEHVATAYQRSGQEDLARHYRAEAGAIVSRCNAGRLLEDMERQEIWTQFSSLLHVMPAEMRPAFVQPLVKLTHMLVSLHLEQEDLRDDRSIRQCFQRATMSKHMFFDCQLSDQTPPNLQPTWWRLRNAVLESGNDNLVELMKEVIEVVKVWVSEQSSPTVPATTWEDLDVEKLLTALAPNEALVEYVALTTGQTKCYAVFVLAQGMPIYLIKLAPVDEVDKLVCKFRQAYQKKKRKRVQEIGRELTTRLLQPVFEVLQWQPTSEHYLRIIPDGALSTLPFAALSSLAGNDRVLLDEEIVIGYLSAARDVLRDGILAAEPDDSARAAGMAPASSSAKRVVLVGNPALDALPGETRTPMGDQRRERSEHVGLLQSENPSELIGAEQEVTRLENLFRDQGVRFWSLRGSEANVDELFRTINAALPDLLHFCGHGNYCPAEGSQVRDPERQVWLEMAGANLWRSRPNNQVLDNQGACRLNASVAKTLHLDGTELATLAACMSGRGDFIQGLGMFSMGRAMLLAGAKSVMTSLEDVEDKSTPELMVAFYQNMLAGQCRAKALRDAQRDLRSKGCPTWTWCPWVLHGKVGPLWMMV